MKSSALLATEVEQTVGLKFPMKTVHFDANAGRKVCGGFQDGAIDITGKHAKTCGR